MATSGSTNLSAVGSDIVNEALEHLGVLPEGGTANADQLTSCGRTLNWLIKHMGAVHGIFFHTSQVWYLFPKKNQREYTLKGAPSDHITTTFSNTFLDGAVASGTSIVVDDASGISSGDKIGVEVASKVMHWTTVNGAPSGNTVTLTATLPSAAPDDGQVYYYTEASSSGDRYFPNTIDSIVYRDKYATDGTLGRDIPVQTFESRADYLQLGDKAATGSTNQYYYEVQNTTATFYVWPTHDDERQYFVIWGDRIIDDLDTLATDDVDFPQHWFLALSWMLAELLTAKYATSPERSRIIIPTANRIFGEVKDTDNQPFIRFKPTGRDTNDGF